MKIKVTKLVVGQKVNLLGLEGSTVLRLDQEGPYIRVTVKTVLGNTYSRQILSTGKVSV